jgi:hypothetical protein
VVVEVAGATDVGYFVVTETGNVKLDLCVYTGP